MPVAVCVIDDSPEVARVIGQDQWHDERRVYSMRVQKQSRCRRAQLIGPNAARYKRRCNISPRRSEVDLRVVRKVGFEEESAINRDRRPIRGTCCDNRGEDAVRTERKIRSDLNVLRNPGRRRISSDDPLGLHVLQSGEIEPALNDVRPEVAAGGDPVDVRRVLQIRNLKLDAFP